MSNYLNILAEIKAKLEAIADIGKVQDYYRYNSDDALFIALFTYTPAGGTEQVRGWEITRESATEHKRGAFFRHHRFKLTGYMSLKDADSTDKTFQTMLENICAAFRATEGSGAWYYSDGDTPENSAVQVQTVSVRAFANILCHYAEISLSVTERIVA